MLTQREGPGAHGRLLEPCPTGIRNRAPIVVLWRAGLRLGGACLEPKDVDRDAGTLVVLHGKGDRRRVLGFDPTALAVLERWIAVRAAKVRHPRRLSARSPSF